MAKIHLRKFGQHVYNSTTLELSKNHQFINCAELSMAICIDTPALSRSTAKRLAGLPTSFALGRAGFRFHGFRRTASARDISGNQRAQLRMPIAAVTDQKRDDRAHTVDVASVNDRAAIARTAQQACPDQDGEMRRQCVVGCTDRLGNNTGRYTERFVFDQEPEYSEPGGLRECGKR